MRHVLIGGFVLSGLSGCSGSPSPAAQPLELGPGGLGSLSGDWVGKEISKQAGKCTIGYRSDRKWQGGALENKESLRLVVNPDGTLIARKIGSDGKELPAEAWWGVISDTLRVVAQYNTKPECQGVTSDVTTRLEGRFNGSPAGPTLELSGLEQTCPKLGCAFAIAYRLVKK